ncbi:hypothetical protein C8R47DRAFT_1123400 [Mycena vitilis]|nr:hypothetical protein C8R47DRAFT_1123400 [Mycena vitilis]
MSTLALVPNLGPLSNREVELQGQGILAIDPSRQLCFTTFPRRDPLPPEILAEIFMHCLPGDEFVTPDLNTAPLLLCGVCRRWRDIALATPPLWSSLLIDFDTMWKTDAHDAVFYQMWLSRARGSPLSINLRDKQGIPVGSLGPLLETIIELSQQWQMIEFEIGADLASYIFPLDGRFPLLRKLEMYIPNHSVSFCCEAPKLRQLWIYPHNPQIQLPWHQLTKLRCFGLSVTSCPEILRKSSSLLDAKFAVACDSSVLPTSILEHDNLLHLNLSAVGEEVDYPFLILILGCLKIPGLKSLVLEYPYHTRLPTGSISPFLPFVSRSRCELHTLTLSYMRTTPDDLIQCLKGTPSLVCLNLTLFVAVGGVFAQLTGHVDFLPKLESFHTFFPYTYEASHLDAYAVVQMLCWRWAAVGGITRLLSFRLGYHRDLKVKFSDSEVLTSHPQCRALQEEGMDLYSGETSDIRSLTYL